MKSLTIGGLADECGINVETVRFYQRRGLLRTPKPEIGIRRYGDEDLRRLRFIRQAQAAGFTLEEIKELIALDAGRDRGRALAMARKRVEALDKKIEELNRARDALHRLEHECGAGLEGPCPIIASFNV